MGDPHPHGTSQCVPHRLSSPLALSASGPRCWPQLPSWMPSRKWLTWPPTPEVGASLLGVGVPSFVWGGGQVVSVPCGVSPAHVSGVDFKEQLHHPREMSNLFPHQGGAFPGKLHWKDGVGRGQEVGTHVGAAPYHPWVLSHIFLVGLEHSGWLSPTPLPPGMHNSPSLSLTLVWEVHWGILAAPGVSREG